MSYRSEKDQIEIFTRWWNTHGIRTLIVAGVLLAVYVGWTQWQAHQQRRAEAASVIFEQFLQVADSSPDQARELLDQLHTQYGDTFYGSAARLFLANEAVIKGDLEAADNHLDALIQSRPSEDLLQVARLRSARVLHDLGRDDEALKRLQDPVAKGFQALFAELRGDIYMARNEADKARAAYEEAKTADESGAGTQQQLLDMKLSQFGVQP